MEKKRGRRVFSAHDDASLAHASSSSRSGIKAVKPAAVVIIQLFINKPSCFRMKWSIVFFLLVTLTFAASINRFIQLWCLQEIHPQFHARWMKREDSCVSFLRKSSLFKTRQLAENNASKKWSFFVVNTIHHYLIVALLSFTLILMVPPPWCHNLTLSLLCVSQF